MNLRRLSRLGLVFMLSVGSGGCSFFFVKGPPLGYRDMEYFSCTGNKTVPVFDAVWGGLTAAGILLGDEPAGGRGEAVFSAAGVIVVFGATAITGFKREDKRRAARMEAARALDASRSLLRGGEITVPPPPEGRRQRRVDRPGP